MSYAHSNSKPARHLNLRPPKFARRVSLAEGPQLPLRMVVSWEESVLR